MASYSKSIASLFLVMLLFAFCQANSRLVNSSKKGGITGPKIDCGIKCQERCKLSSRPNLCKRSCGTCCARCSCVPPGTAGNYETCSCYANMTTHGGRRKCP